MKKTVLAAEVVLAFTACRNGETKAPEGEAAEPVVEQTEGTVTGGVAKVAYIQIDYTRLD